MPTIQSQRRGSRSPGIVGMPGKRFGAARPNLAGTITVQAKPFRSQLGTLNMMLAGVSRDSTGAPLAECQVLIFRTEDRSFVGETMSDINGNWSISMMKGGPFFFVEYKVGTPDVFGTSLNTRVPG